MTKSICKLIYGYMAVTYATLFLGVLISDTLYDGKARILCGTTVPRYFVPGIMNVPPVVIWLLFGMMIAVTAICAIIFKQFTLGIGITNHARRLPLQAEVPRRGRRQGQAGQRLRQEGRGSGDIACLSIKPKSSSRPATAGTARFPSTAKSTSRRAAPTAGTEDAAAISSLWCQRISPRSPTSATSGSHARRLPLQAEVPRRGRRQGQAGQRLRQEGRGSGRSGAAWYRRAGRGERQNHRRPFGR